MRRGYSSSGVVASTLTPPPSGRAPGAAITLPASPHVPSFNLGCNHCDWQANNVPETVAARVIVRHMETQHGARS